jgi:hypothetical protein
MQTMSICRLTIHIPQATVQSSGSCLQFTQLEAYLMAPDLGKMVGPMPLGAWIAVVGGGLGFALYSRSQSAAAPVDTGMAPEDTSGTFPALGLAEAVNGLT